MKKKILEKKREIIKGSYVLYKTLHRAWILRVRVGALKCNGEFFFVLDNGHTMWNGCSTPDSRVL